MQSYPLSAPRLTAAAFKVTSDSRSEEKIPSEENKIRRLCDLVHRLCSSGRYSEAHHRLLLSLASGWLPDSHACNVLLSRLLAARSPHLTLRLLRRLFSAKPSFLPSLTVYNKLIHQFCSLSRPHDARQLFLDMIIRGRHPDVVSCTALIKGFCSAGELPLARHLFDEMRHAGIPPNSLTHSVLLRGLLRKRFVEEGTRMIDELWEVMAAEDDSSVKNAAFSNLIDALCQEGFFRKVFKIAEHPPTEICVSRDFAYAQMIDSLCRCNRHHGASRVVYLMKKRGFSPSLVSYNSIVHGLSKQGEGGCLRAYQLIQEAAHLGYSPPEPTYRSLIQTLCCTKHFLQARDLALFMLSKQCMDDNHIFNLLLHGLLDDPNEQLNILVLMLEKGCRPDAISLNTVIQGFCNKGGVDQGLKILNDMQKGGFSSPDVVTFTIVLHGLLYNGRVEEAMEMFRHTMRVNSCNPNIVTYNTVLKGLYELGDADEAAIVFRDMQQSSVPVEARTYAIVLHGLLATGRDAEAKALWEDIVWPSGLHDCFVYTAMVRGLCNLGRLEEARDFAYELVDCGVSPGIVCYNVLLDAASRRGLKKEAYLIISEMRKNGLKPDPISWRILGKLHKLLMADAQTIHCLESRDK